jgi:translation initiation factor IF-3
MFRGREQSRPELGRRLLDRLSKEIAELGFVEAAPKQDGRNMIMVIAPHRSLKVAARGAKAGVEGAEGVEGADGLEQAAPLDVAATNGTGE